MHLILTGATGLVGSGVLDAMIKMKDVTKISILSRRPVQHAEDAKDPRINVIIHKDFEKYDPSVLAQLKGANGCVWALGKSTMQVTKDEYVKLTKDYALAAAEAFRGIAPENEPFNFVFVSGRGVTTEPGRFTPLYARVKGETEVALAKIRNENPLMRISSVRPGGVDGTAHEATKPYQPAMPVAYRVLSPLLTPIALLYPSMHSPTKELGVFLTEMAMGKHNVTAPDNDIQMIGQFPILENSAFRRMSGLKSKLF
ncbi:putative nucleoside-diphosphate-sugar epimerase [Xylariaceae sp. FL0255]|nr:putative nucleoside-diphosphate-sugar epimerase [Xylariaceae sp. FL0255]